MLKIKTIIEEKEKLNKNLKEQIDKKLAEKIIPLFICNGLCSYCSIDHKCLEI